MAVTLFTDRRMLDHRVPARHPERPERLQAILRHLERTGYLATCPSGQVREATAAELGRVHPAEYQRRVAELEAAGGGMLDPDTWVFSGLEPGGQAGGRCVHRGGLVRHGGEDRRASAWSDRRAPCPAGRGDGVLHLRQRRSGRGRSHRDTSMSTGS